MPSQVSQHVLSVVLVLLLAGCASAPPANAPPGLSTCGAQLDGFAHRDADLPGARLHYVIGGTGPAIVLLHGFPETWQSWQGVAPRLAATHTVIMPDLRGIGCSSITAGGYDSQSMARDVHNLVAALGLRQVTVVGHDLGGWVAFAYARAYRAEVDHLVISGAVIPGFGTERLLDFTEPGRGLPHLVLFQQPGLGEQLIIGHERMFLSRFVGSPRVLATPAFDAAVAEYSRPGRVTAALGQYRALYVDIADNRRALTQPLGMPALALDGQDVGTQTADSLRRVASDVRVVSIPDAGHYAPQERPDAYAGALLTFLAGAGR